MKAKFKKLLKEARKIVEGGRYDGTSYFFVDDAETAGFDGDAILDMAATSMPAPSRRDGAGAEDGDRTRGRKRRGHRQFAKDSW
jgi:hypothetical protein